jgi:tetratricopeptide (TPR) repeat protein
MRGLSAILMLAGAAALLQAQEPKPAEKSTFDGDFGIALVNKDGRNKGPNEETAAIAIRYYSKDDKPNTITGVQLTVHYVFDIAGTKSTNGMETRTPQTIAKWNSGDLITLAITPADVQWVWITVEGTSGNEKFKFEMPQPGPPEGKPADFPGAIRFDVLSAPRFARDSVCTIRIWYELDAGSKGPVEWVDGEVTVVTVWRKEKKIPFRYREWQPGRAGAREFSFSEEPDFRTPFVLNGKGSLGGKPVGLHVRIGMEDLYQKDVPEGTEVLPRDFRDKVSEAGGDADKNYPLPQNPKASEARIEGVIRKWEEALKAGFEKGPGAKAPWARKMKRAIETFATMQLFRGINQQFNPARRAFALAVVAAVAEGADDPLLRFWMFNWFHITDGKTKYTSSQGVDIDPESHADLLRAVSASTYPALMKIHMAHVLVVKMKESKKYRPKKAPPEYDKALADGIKAADAFCWEQIAALAGSEEPEELDAVIDVMIGLLNTNDLPEAKHATDLIARLAETKAPKWLLLYLEGEMMNIVAWRWRNGENEPLFEEQMGIARERFEASAKLEPKQPYAFTGMITVCMAFGLEREEMEKWFRKAMEINPDEWNACHRKLKYLRPTRQGSWDDYFDFLDQCIRTKNWRAGIPQLADSSLAELYMNIPARFGYDLGHPAIFCRVQTAFETVTAAAPKNPSPIVTYALACMGSHRWQEALDALARLDEGELRPNPFGPALDLAVYRAYCRNRLPVK